MNRAPDYEKLSVFEQIREGLKDAVSHARAELSLRTTVLVQPAPRMTKARVAAA